MILPGILFLGMAIVLLVLYVFINTAFDYIFGHIGAFLVCLVSFGRIRMAPLSGGESELATWLGVAATLLLMFGITYIIQNP
jgi:hypothetical protein